jgi:hypothetical protein
VGSFCGTGALARMNTNGVPIQSPAPSPASFPVSRWRYGLSVRTQPVLKVPPAQQYA